MMVALDLALGSPVPWRSPFEASYSPDGKWLVVTDRTADRLVMIDPAAGSVSKEIALGEQPAGLVWGSDSESVFVSEYGTGRVVEVNPARGEVIRRLTVGRGPMGLALAARSKRLLVCNSHNNGLSVLDLVGGRELVRVALVREPGWVAVSPDESMAMVGNMLPLGDATDPKMSACVSLIDLTGLKKLTDIPLVTGASNCRGVAISVDGRWGYVLHTIGKAMQPTTELEGGWVNLNALSILDLKSKSLAATVYLDRLTEGATDPWGIVLSPDQKRLWITLSGIHQLMQVDREKLHEFLEGKALQGGLMPNWRLAEVTVRETAGFPRERLVAAMDLTSLYLSGVIKRTPLEGKTPRGLALSPDGRQLAVPMYYSGGLLLIDTVSGHRTKTISLGPASLLDKRRRGELVFHDASYCYQHWLSCATCHPNGRADGLNWDLLNDGIGNPKNTRSLLWSHKLPMMMTLGVRKGLETAVEAGFRSIQYYEPAHEEVECVVAYLQSLQPEPSPHLMPDGQLSPSAKRGKELFTGKADCAGCHPEPVFSDGQMHDVGTTREMDKGKKLKTTSLIELWRTAPYLNDGRAVTLKEVLIKFNPQDQHGTTSSLTSSELKDLVEYLLSL